MPVVDLGRTSYDRAFAIQQSHVNEVLASRDAGRPEIGRLLLVEHDPVITVSRRPGARENLLASPARLAQLGVDVVETDRGGDITYHGPGQLVVYPILDLNRLNLGLHAYMRLLEQAVIDACACWGVPAERDEGATGVWVRHGGQLAKIAAMGVRIRRWVSMHGLALNVAPDMSHFRLIVPCGLPGRPVTCLATEMAAAGRTAPLMSEAAGVLCRCLTGAIEDAAAGADRMRSPDMGDRSVRSIPGQTDRQSR